MKKSKALITSFAALSALLLTACPGNKEEPYYVTGDYLTGKPAKRSYNAYIGSAPSTLDARKSQSVENISHLANFEDCLVMNDGYGILRKSLAATATRNADRTEFAFTVKENIPWVTCDGQQYEYRNQKQYVTVDDFVTTAKQILDYSNESEIYYMYTLFISNAWEYYCYTMMETYLIDEKTVDGVKYDFIDNYDKQAEALTNLVRKHSNAEPETPITGDDIADIHDFKRVGVKIENREGKRTLVYKLNQPADFFPTMLTYTPYTPINSHFLAQHKSDYGTKRNTILYCGPFLLKEYSSERLQYAKNELYWNKDYVHIDTVNYTTVDTSLGYEEQRKAFDDGRVDGFGLSKEDKTGWSMYIEGPDGTGTIEHPYSSSVNSRELDDVDYTYHFVLNPNRSTEVESYNKSGFYNLTFKGGKATDEEKVADIENTNKALKLQEVRRLVLNGIDLESYNLHYNAPERDQYQMNTFTPRGYVYDGAGIDYVDYYYAYFAEQKGLANESDSFDDKVAAGKKAVGPQQITGVNYTNEPLVVAEYPWLSLSSLSARAKKSVDLYNEMNASAQITLPVNIEYLGISGLDPKSNTHEKNQVLLWNERANGCTLDSSRVTDELPKCQGDSYPYFYMRLSTVGSQDNFSTIANNGYYSMYTGWGWVGDYADPLTYVHCYATNGEMAKMSGNNDVNLPSYRLNEAGTELSEEFMYESYNAAVVAANSERTSTTKRYQEFAKVEYQLLNDLYLIRPAAMYTQGWSASVSRAAGYENPQAHYGLADNILAGMWVLVDVPTGAERQKARDDRKAREVQELAKYGNNAINGAFDDWKVIA